MSGQRNWRDYFGEDITATFGSADVGGEIIGPMKPKGVDFGYIKMGRRFDPEPMVVFHFNKFRPDLPQWDSVVEFVLASPLGRALFTDITHVGTEVSGSLKTVRVRASEGIVNTVDGTVVTRKKVAEKRDMDRDDDVSSGAEFKVTEELT